MFGIAPWMIVVIFIAMLIVVNIRTTVGARPDDITIEEYVPAGDALSACTHIEFRDELELVTAGSRLYFREGRSEKFRASPLEGLNDAHSLAYNSKDQLFYITDSGNHRLVAFRDPARNEIVMSATKLAGVTLDRPHDIICDSAKGWLYALNPNRVAVFRFRGIGQDETSLDLSGELGYSRSLTLAGGKLYVIGSSAGKVVEVDDFERGKFHVYTSFGKRRDAPAGSWKTTGLVPNDADFYRGYWYVTSYFCPKYAAGEDCNENKFIRFRTWREFETGDWEDLSGLLPGDIVPYYLTLRNEGLYIAAFYHEADGAPGQVFRITGQSK